MDKTIRIICTKSNNVDGSIGNSIFKWAQGYYLNYKCNFEYKIILEEEVWSELNLIDLPYTETMKGDLKENAFKIELPLLKDVFLNDNVDELKSHDHLYLDEWYIFDGPSLRYIDDDGEIKGQIIDCGAVDPLRLIKFKNEEVENFFKEEFSDFVGIHIRRFCGVIIGKGELETLPKEIVYDFYRDYLRSSIPYIQGWRTLNNEKYVHPFISDEHYYRAIEEILDYNINQKFYLSTDIPHKYYQYYKERYNNIYDKYDYFEKFEKIVKKHHEKILNFDASNIPNNVLERYGKPEYLVFANLLDIFALSNSKLIIQSFLSSWGRICKRIRDTNQILLPLSSKNTECPPKKFFDTIKYIYKDRMKYSTLKILMENVID